MRKGSIVLAQLLVVLAVIAPAANADVIVSLGDSYSSGEGAPVHKPHEPRWDHGTGAYDPQPGNSCHRSANAWPRLLGVQMGYHLACSGAKIANLYKRQRRTGPDRQSQIARLDQIAASTDIATVVMTIGGNDIGFAGKIRSCFFGNNCLHDRDRMQRELDDLKTKLVAAYGDVADAAASDTVVVGYPDIVPGEGKPKRKCNWLSSTDRPNIHWLEQHLDETIRAAADAADVDYISIRDALRGHELCTADSWMNPIGSLTSKLQGHPNAIGQQAIEDKVARGLAAIQAADTSGTIRTVATARRTRTCGAIAFSSQSEDGVFDIRARGTGCHTAVASRARRVHSASSMDHTSTAHAGFGAAGCTARTRYRR